MAARKVTIRNVSAGSVFKVATLLALFGFIAWMLAAVLVYLALDRAGVVESINSLIGGVGGDQVVDMKLAMMAAALFGLAGVVFMSIMAPLTAIMYNAVADLVGGVRYTMPNRAK